MELIKQWIEEIRAAGEEYASGYWTCRITADMAEFRLKAPIIYNKEKFKHTVIKIGMILTRISRLLETEDRAFHIQTFPLLEDLRIVAVVRFNVNLNLGKDLIQHRPVVPENSDHPIMPYADNRAKQLKFDLLKIDHFDAPDTFSVQKDWYLLGSNHNNPFTWINVGYLAEELLLHTAFTDSRNTPEILSGLTLLKITGKPVVNNCPQFIHAYIGF